MGSAGRLGIYVDDLYVVVVESNGSASVSTDRAFMIFAAEVAGQLGDELLVLGRTTHADTPSDHVLPTGTGLVELPGYTDLTRLGEVLRALPGTTRAMWSGLAQTDRVWIFGPHPFGVLLAILALIRRKKPILGVRQDTLGYYRSRLRSRRWKPALVLAWGLDRIYHLLARRLPSTIVGREVAASYGLDRPTVLRMTVTLVSEADVVASVPQHDWDGRIELLTVGRLEQEKNPFLLIDVLERLERRYPGRYRLTWVGRGPLEDEFARRAREAGVEEAIHLAGYVPYGRELLDLYRNSHLFVHVSLTEGVPQVLIEAFASGLPIVATDVGGVSAALEQGAAGLLVPPSQAEPLVDAIVRLSESADERERIAQRGLELVRLLTVEAEAERVARFIERGRKE